MELEHQALAESVLNRLQEFGFKVKKEKMQWCQGTIVFLGHAASAGCYNLQPVLQKLEENMPEVDGRHSLQQALGLFNGLKPRDVQFGSMVAEFYKIGADVGMITD